MIICWDDVGGGEGRFSFEEEEEEEEVSGTSALFFGGGAAAGGGGLLRASISRSSSSRSLLRSSSVFFAGAGGAGVDFSFVLAEVARAERGAAMSLDSLAVVTSSDGVSFLFGIWDVKQMTFIGTFYGVGGGEEMKVFCD